MIYNEENEDPKRHRIIGGKLNMENILREVSKIGVIPVIRIDELENAVPLAGALRQGGIHTIEVTVRNEIAFEAIRMIHSAYPDVYVGAGTILTINMVDEALKAGAKYIVTPGFNQSVVRYCVEHQIPVVPGCVTPTEIDMAYEMGLSVVKFFPAEKSGGVEAIELISGPYPKMRFIPTGGINFQNLETYLRNEKVLACGGSFMAKSDLISAKNWEKITENCKEAVAKSLGFELAHVGLNHDNGEQALEHANMFHRLFGLGVKDGDASVFCGTAVEFMKTNYYGEKGHIGFYTNSVPRALQWFKDSGIALWEDSIRYDKKGKMVSFYLQQEIGGFAVHVVMRPQ